KSSLEAAPERAHNSSGTQSAMCPVGRPHDGRGGAIDGGQANMLQTILNASGANPGKVKGGRLEFLVPHLVRGQFLRPGFVRMSLSLGVAQRMPYWAKLQFINCGVDPRDLDEVLGRIT